MVPSLHNIPMQADSIPNVRRQHGNSNAAGDLYGLGIRVGAYLQVFGMLLSCLRSGKRRIGIRLLSSAVCVSLLLSWTILACRRDISPCEAWLVLSLINAYGTPRSAAMNDRGKKAGGIGLSFAGLSEVWQSISFMWFFATLFRELPLLGTYNRVWFFTAVDISGWFRILMLVYGSLLCLLLPVQVVSYLNLIEEAFDVWAKGQTVNGSNGDEELLRMWGDFMRKIAKVSKKLQSNVVFNKIDKLNEKFWTRLLRIKKMSRSAMMKQLDDKRRFVRIVWCFWGLLILVLTIVGVEKIIRYNDLSPQNDLSQPGQIIPFVLGIITIIEGLGNACMPTSPSNSSRRDTHTTNNLTPVSINSIAYQDELQKVGIGGESSRK